LQILEAYNTGVKAFRQQKSDGLTADRIDSTMLDMEEVTTTTCNFHRMNNLPQ